MKQVSKIDLIKDYFSIEDEGDGIFKIEITDEGEKFLNRELKANPEFKTHEDYLQDLFIKSIKYYLTNNK